MPEAEVKVLEIIDLPGVIPVRCAGRQRASANTRRQDYDIGEDWKPDVGSLERAFRTCVREFPEIRRELLEGRAMILGRHAVEDIRNDWIAALNAHYANHIDTVRLDLPAILSEKGLGFREGLPIRFNLESADFKHATGSVVEGRVYCIKDTHRPGHCLYGPDYRVVESERLKVQFTIDVLRVDEENRERVALDVYDNASEEIVVFHAIENQFVLEFDAVEGQSLEFRVYWHGSCDICVTGVDLQQKVPEQGTWPGARKRDPLPCGPCE